MTTFLTSLHILTFKQDVIVNAGGIDITNIYDSHKNLQEAYYEEKQNFIKSRSSKCKQTQRFKENMKELDELFSSHRCLFLKWDFQEPLLLFFSNGTIASIKIDETKSDVEKIIIDSYLCGKLPSDHLTDVILDQSCLLISYSEPKLTHIHFSKQSPSFPTKLLGNKKGKIVGFEPQIINVDFVGPSSRRLEKKLSLNNLKELILIWWRFTNDDVWPWMPVNYSIDRINMLVYTLNGASVEALCSAKVHGELVHAGFSKWHSNRVLTLEEILENENFCVNVCTYEITRGRCQCVSLFKLPLHGRLIAFDWSSSEDKLLLSDSDRNLFIFDVNNNTTLVTSTLFVSKEVSWHPDGAIAVVVGSNGQLQCFDAALTLIKLEVYGENSVPSKYIELMSIFQQKFFVQRILWQNSNMKQNICAPNSCNDISDTLLIFFETGISVLVKFDFGCVTKNVVTPLELISQYLKSGSVDESICLLQSLNWRQQSELCFQCLSKIATFLLRKSLNLQIEAALELSLGTFYNSVGNLPETLLHDYQQQVNHLARRFFHQLLRYHRFEKAFLLAVDLQSRDLFLDLHHVAKEKGERMLAVVAFQRAEELEVSGSSCSDESVLSDDETGSCSSSDDKSNGNAPFIQHSFTPGKDTNSCQEYSSLNHRSPNYGRESACPNNQNNFNLSYLPKGSHVDLCSKVKKITSPQFSTEESLNNSKSASAFNTSASNSFSYKKFTFPKSSLCSITKSDAVSELCKGNLPFPPDILKHVSEESLLRHSTLDSMCMLSHHMPPHDLNDSQKCPSVQNENFEDDDEDVEGARVKFVHFGIV